MPDAEPAPDVRLIVTIHDDGHVDMWSRDNLTRAQAAHLFAETAVAMIEGDLERVDPSN